MAKNIHDLYKKYSEMQNQGQNMADGGKVEDDDSVLSDLADSFKKAFSTPKTSPTPDPTLDEKYEKIREQNQRNFDNPHAQSLFEGGISGSIHKYQYAEGGKVEHDKSNLKDLKAAFDKFMSEESKETKMSGGGLAAAPAHNYSEGGNVLDANARKHIAPKNFAGPDRSYPINDINHARNALARVSQHGSPELQAKVRSKVHSKYPSIGMADGGEVNIAAPNNGKLHNEPLELYKKYLNLNKPQHLQSGGMALDPAKVAQYKALYPGVSDDQVASMIASEHPAVQAPPIPQSAAMSAKFSAPQGSDTGSLAGNINDQLAQTQVGQGMADGGVAGDPITGQIDPNSPEGLAMIANSSYPEADKIAPEAQVQDEAPEYITSDQGPAKEAIMEEENPDDKALEEKIADEDFSAGEDSDKNRESASDEKETEDEDELGNNQKENDNGEVLSTSPAGLQVSPEIQKAIQALQSKPQTDLDKAQKDRDFNVLGQEVAKYGALAGAGLLGRPGINVSPNPALGVINSNDKNAGMPVEKYQEQLANQKNDANSQVSQAYRDVYGKVMGSPANPKWSASDIGTTLPVIEKYMQAQQMAQARTQMMQDKLTQQAQQKEQDRELKRTLASEKNETQAQAKQAAADTKSQHDQDLAWQKTQSLLESARGQKSTQQAESDIQNAAKFNSLYNLYGDPDKLSTQLAPLGTMEIAKMGIGGVPAGHEIDALQPGTAAFKLNNLWSKFTNDPQPANMGAYLKGYKDYADALNKDAQNLVTNRYGRIIESNKRQIGADNYQSAQDQYINRFKNQEAESKSNPGKTISKAEYKAYSDKYGPDKASKLLSVGGYTLGQ